MCCVALESKAMSDDRIGGFAASTFAAYIKRLGYSSLVVLSDGEHSLRLLVLGAQKILKADSITMDPRVVPKHSSQSLGFTGQKQLMLQRQIRVLKAHLYAKTGRWIDPTMPLWP